MKVHKLVTMKEVAEETKKKLDELLTRLVAARDFLASEEENYSDGDVGETVSVVRDLPREIHLTKLARDDVKRVCQFLHDIIGELEITMKAS